VAVYWYGMLDSFQLWRTPWFTPRADSEDCNKVYVLWVMMYRAPAHFIMLAVFPGLQGILGIPRVLTIT